VFRDLKPYVCTFKECDLRMFRSRHEWFAHELQVHRREWVCQYCHQEPFATAASFSNHLVSTHPAVLKGSKLEAIVLQSEEPIGKVPATACKLCDQWEIEVRSKIQDSAEPFPDEKKMEQYSSPAKFRKHLGRHMEQLALFALPMDKGKEDEDLSSEGAEDDLSDHVEEDSRVENFGHDALAEEENTLSENSRDDNIQSGHSKREIADPPFTPDNIARVQSTFFINGDGIDREVIATDICRYVGNDALVKPGTHKVNHLSNAFRFYSISIAEQLYRTNLLDKFRMVSTLPHTGPLPQYV
jgi:hypothetical protein